MFGFAKFDEHAELVGRMAETLGADIAEEMLAGRLTPEDLRYAVLRCIGCREAGECQEFLAGHEAGGAGSAPDYCRNKALLEAMGAD